MYDVLSGVKAVSPSSEVWVLWGDGSSCYSLAEVEPAVRHNLPFIAIIGRGGECSLDLNTVYNPRFTGRLINMASN